MRQLIQDKSDEHIVRIFRLRQRVVLHQRFLSLSVSRITAYTTAALACNMVRTRNRFTGVVDARGRPPVLDAFLLDDMQRRIRLIQRPKGLPMRPVHMLLPFHAIIKHRRRLKLVKDKQQRPEQQDKKLHRYLEHHDH